MSGEKGEDDEKPHLDPYTADTRSEQRIREEGTGSCRQVEPGQNGYNSQVTLASGPAAAIQLAAMKRDPSGSYRDSAYGGSYAAVSEPQETRTGSQAVFPTARPTGLPSTHLPNQESISDNDWQSALRSEAARYASRSSTNPQHGQAGWLSHSARYQAGPDRAPYDAGGEEAWTSSRPRSYREDQGIPGDPRLY